MTRPGATAPQRAGAGGVVLSSSGTTGTPKVVRLGQDKLLHTARCVASHLELEPEDRGFNPLPLFHINAEVVGLLSALVAGSSLVLDDRFHRSGFWDLMASRSITWINAVPAIISRLGTLGPDETVPSGIRFIRSASAPLPVAVADRFEASTGIPVIETYGMTEAASQITAHPLSVPRRAGSVGLPVGVELRIVRQTEPVGSPLEAPEFHIGHVEIRGVSVIDGLRRRHAPGPLPSGRLAAHGRPGPQGRRRLRLPGCPDRRRDQPRRREGPAPGGGGGHRRRPHGRRGGRRGSGRPRAGPGPRGVRRPAGARRCAAATAPDAGSGARGGGARPKVLERDLVRAKRPVALCVVERAAGGCHGQGQAPPAGHARGARPVHASICGDDGRVAALAGAARPGHPQAARPH